MASDGPLLTDWLQAGAALASVGVAIWGTAIAYSARRTSREARDAGESAREAGEEARTAGDAARSAGGEARLVTALTARFTADVTNEAINGRLRSEGKTVWVIQKAEGDSYTFTNDGTQDVKLIGAREVGREEGSHDDVMLLPGYEGVHISPGNYFKVILARSLASPPVTRVEVEWEEGPRTVKQVYAIA